MPDADLKTRLRALHTRRQWNWVKDGRANRPPAPVPDRCDHCRADWPCATIREIDAS